MSSHPSYAVIFSSQRNSHSQDDYLAIAEKMLAMAKEQPGFLGAESSRDESGKGITISYWSSLEDIKAWKAVKDHLEAQAKGRDQWYDSYSVRICRIKEEYSFKAR